MSFLMSCKNGQLVIRAPLFLALLPPKTVRRDAPCCLESAKANRLSNTEIAVRLVMSVPTAETHVSRILAKLAARDRAQLVVFAYQAGLVTPG
jgi:hypothetical protein